MDELSALEKETFEKEHSDLNWYKGKQSKEKQAAEERRKSKKTSRSTHPHGFQPHSHAKKALTAEQSGIFRKVEAFVNAPRDSAPLTFLNTFSARDREFIRKLGTDLNLDLAWDEYNSDDDNVVTIRFPASDNDGDSENGEDLEAKFAIERVINQYSRLDIIDTDEASFDAREEARYKQRMDDWKRSYYRVSPPSLLPLCSMRS